MRSHLALVALVACSTACGAASRVPTAAEPPVLDAPAEETRVDVPAPSAPACVVPTPTGPVPDLLLEAELPVAPAARRRGGRRVIVLDEIDGYGPLHVLRADRAGQFVDLGLGSDPRLLEDGSFAFLETDPTLHTTTFVRVAHDGSITRSPGGNGRAGGLGGPASSRRSPFTRDGRFMAWVTEDEGEGSHLELFDRYPTTGDVAPIEHLPVASRAHLVAITEDGRRLGVCLESASSVSTFDRETRAWTMVPFEGRCVAIAPDLSSVLVVPTEPGPGLARVSLPSGERQELSTTMPLGSVAYDRCGASAVMTGLVNETTQRAERVFFDGRAPLTLIDTPIEPRVFIEIEIDHRGWVLVSSEDARDEIATWVVPLEGGEVHARVIDVGARIFGAKLGPDPSLEDAAVD